VSWVKSRLEKMPDSSTASEYSNCRYPAARFSDLGVCCISPCLATKAHPFSQFSRPPFAAPRFTPFSWNRGTIHLFELSSSCSAPACMGSCLLHINKLQLKYSACVRAMTAFLVQCSAPEGSGARTPLERFTFLLQVIHQHNGNLSLYVHGTQVIIFSNASKGYICSQHRRVRTCRPFSKGDA
jgi:hypothetical protein